MSWLTDLLGLIPEEKEVKGWVEKLMGKKNEKETQMKNFIPQQTAPPEPTYTPNEQGVRDLYKSQLGTSNQETTNLDEYYPLLAESDYVKEKSSRPGMYELMMLMGLQESTGGKATTNAFGVRPDGGMGQFEDIQSAVDYQVSPNVFGGGVNDSLNLLKGRGMISEDEIRKIMKSYNPEQVYLEWLVENYRKLTQ